MSRRPLGRTVLLAGLLAIPFAATGASRSSRAATRRDAIVAAVERASPAVVGVRTQVMVASRRADPFNWFFRDFAQPRSPRRRLETLSQGSGVIIDAGGYVLTNYHVVAAGGDIEIELHDHRTLAARVVGTSPDHDLAVLKTERGDLPHIAIGSSSGLMIGETVIAIGNPFGLSHSVTTGVISALHRSIRADDRTYTDFIQTDAAINPGNSGGPLLTIDGALVGVNTAIYGKAQGIGFAIPIDRARRIVNDLLRYGEVRRPYFGFEVQALTPDLAASFGIDDRRGALVSFVDPKGPAAGKLREGDVITTLGTVPIDDHEQLRLFLGDETVGAPVRVEYVRDRTRRSVQVRAAELSGAEALALLWAKIGIKVEEIPVREARRLQLPEGLVMIRSVARGSPASRVGIRPADWIRAVNSEKVIGLQELSKAIARTYWRGRISLLIQRGNVWQPIAFEF